ncbi:Uncharacterised protein [Aquipseudomonas alcaligenes]|nr:Uncharacterised protein [Pseudomonas alcaligenes]
MAISVSGYGKPCMKCNFFFLIYINIWVFYEVADYVGGLLYLRHKPFIYLKSFFKYLAGVFLNS